MPQEVVPSRCFLRKGHLKSISQQAPQRLHSPRRKASDSTTSSRRKRMRTKRRSLPCAWRARNLASSTARARLAFKRSSNERRLAARLAGVVFITRDRTSLDVQPDEPREPGKCGRLKAAHTTP